MLGGMSIAFEDAVPKCDQNAVYSTEARELSSEECIKLQLQNGGWFQNTRLQNWSSMQRHIGIFSIKEMKRDSLRIGIGLRENLKNYVVVVKIHVCQK